MELGSADANRFDRCRRARGRCVDCRIKNGPAGRCVRKVLGYACVEVRTTTPAGINGRVTCKNKKKRVVHAYQQNA